MSELDQRTSMVKLAGQWIAMIAIIAAPWMLGSVNNLPQLVLHVISIVVVTLFVSQDWREIKICWISWLLCGALLFGALHLAPFGSQVAAAFGSTNTMVREDLAGVPPNELGNLPHTICAEASRRELSLLALVTNGFLLGTVAFRRRKAFVTLLGLLAANGAALCLLGVAQMVSESDEIYWTYTADRASAFGPFTYRNQAGGYFVLCGAAAIGWLHRQTSGAAPKALNTSPRELLMTLDGRKMTVITIGLFVIVGLVLSLSLGAIVSGLVALSVWLLLRVFMGARVGQSSVLLLPIMVVMVVVVIAWLGMSNVVSAELESVLDSDTYSQDNRLSHWEVGLQTAGDYWGLGSGIGTYRYAHLRFENEYFTQWYQRAHNQYLETLVDFGWLGVVLLLAAISIFAVELGRLWRDGKSETRMFAAVGTLLLTSQVIHAFVDFVLYLPANGFLMAVLCGAISGRAGSLASKANADVKPRSSGRLQWCVLAISLAFGVWSLPVLRYAILRDTAVSQIPWHDDASKLTEHRLVEWQRRIESIVRDDDAEAHEALGELWVHLYRVRGRRDMANELALELDDPNSWAWTHPLIIQNRAYTFFAENDTASLRELREQEIVVANLGPALQHFERSRRSCPLLARVHLRMAELCFLTSPPTEDAQHLKHLSKLVSSDPELLFEAGRLHFSAERYDEAYAHWKRSLTLKATHELDILLLASQQLKFPELVDNVFPHEPQFLLRWAEDNVELKSDRQRLLVQRIVDHIEHEHDEATKLFLLGRVAYAEHRFVAAAEKIEAAIAKRPHNIQWRMKLVEILIDAKRLGEARSEARIGIELGGDTRQMERLLRRIERLMKNRK